MTDKQLQKDVQKIIEQWVGRNYGTQEMDDPSWNIKALSRCIAKELNKKINSTMPKPNHELTVLLHEDADKDEAIEKLKTLVENKGGMIIKTEDDGVKRLAYAIQGQEKARYIYFDIILPLNKASELSSVLNITDTVLRYLLVRTDPRF